MLETLLSAWAMNEADFVEVVALSAWVTSDPPYLATTSRSKIEVQDQLVSTVRNNQVSSFYVDEIGDETVITLDVPIMATLDAPVAIVQIAHNQANKQKFDYLLKSCQEVPSGFSVGTEISNIGPSFVLSEYLRVYKGRDIDQRLIKETLIEKPKHGEIKLIYESELDRFGSLYYIPFAVGDRNGRVGYEGKDRVAYLLEFSGKRYKLIINLIVTESGDLTDVGVPSRCPASKLIKLNSLFNSATPGVDEKYDYIPSNVTFRDLTGVAVGETVGEGANASITLDSDAAGHGWYIGGLTTEDRGQNLSTPSSIFNPLSSVFSPPSSDWLPTSNPNEWVARAGTSAAGKMDMLSVLLHEYGHALGLEHSSDSHDYMGTTLTPGMRRLPSGDEMQLMAQLAGEAREAIVAGNGYTLIANRTDTLTTDMFTPTPALPLEGGGGSLPINMGFGISFLGLLRRNSSTSSIFANAAPAQYDIAANTTLTNGNFAGNNTNAWETTGKVNANNGTAVLSEVSTSQTRLNQVFVVGANDRYLSFTLSNIGLDDVNTGPDDAFEVALLNANTGASFTAPIGLTRSDALLNIQANGAELKATGVTSVVNTDGSRTYVVDLAGIAVGTAVNLSFDLIGFGNTVANTNSHVTVRDVRLKPAIITPQLSNDAAAGAEDTVMQIIALANDLNIVQANTSFDPIIVAAPMHGTVVIMRMAAYICIAHMRDLHKSLAINQA